MEGSARYFGTRVMRLNRASVAIIANVLIIGMCSLGSGAQTAAKHGSALFQVEIGAADLMRKTACTMVFDPAYDGPTILSWKCAHDLKLGNCNRDVFRPSHNAQVPIKRRT